MYYQNVRSVRRKLSFLNFNLSMFVDRPEIIILTETWLHEGIMNQELNLSNYNIYRKDRFKRNLTSVNAVSDECVRDGGVLIAISKVLKSSSIDVKLLQQDSILSEELYVKVTIGKNKFLLEAVYIPPGSPICVYENHLKKVENISRFYSDHRLLITGDFNLPKISWNFNDYLICDFLEGSSLPSKQAASLICDLYNSSNLKQFFPPHPNKTYTLDLLFENNDLVEYLHSSDHLVPLEFSHHVSATFGINIPCSHLQYNHTSKYNFRDIDDEALATCLGSLNWNDILDFDFLNLNESINLFYDILEAAVDLSVPKIGKLPRKFPG